MNTQPALWHDTLSDALRDVVHALGGPKVVASDLWPSKDPADAARLLNKCLDPERAEKLALEEIEWLIVRSRAANVHLAMAYLAMKAGYADPKPIEPEDERAELMREFIEKAQVLEHLGKRLGVRL